MFFFSQQFVLIVGRVCLNKKRSNDESWVYVCVVFFGHDEDGIVRIDEVFNVAAQQTTTRVVRRRYSCISTRDANGAVVLGRGQGTSRDGTLPREI